MGNHIYNIIIMSVNSYKTPKRPRYINSSPFTNNKSQIKNNEIVSANKNNDNKYNTKYSTPLLIVNTSYLSPTFIDASYNRYSPPNMRNSGNYIDKQNINSADK